MVDVKVVKRWEADCSSYVTAYLGDPLLAPVHSLINTLIGLVVFMVITMLEYLTWELCKIKSHGKRSNSNFHRYSATSQSILPRTYRQHRVLTR